MEADHNAYNEDNACWTKNWKTLREDWEERPLEAIRMEGLEMLPPHLAPPPTETPLTTTAMALVLKGLFAFATRLQAFPDELQQPFTGFSGKLGEAVARFEISLTDLFVLMGALAMDSQNEGLWQTDTNCLIFLKPTCTPKHPPQSVSFLFSVQHVVVRRRKERSEQL